MAGHKSRIMYMEQKTGAKAGEARIGRVGFSRSGRTLYYGDKLFVAVGGRGIHGNYQGYDRAIYEAWVKAKQEPNQYPVPAFLGEFWISGPKKNGHDRHPLETGGPVIVDSDVAEEYWDEIRQE
jgi:hypothetical protein